MKKFRPCPIPKKLMFKCDRGRGYRFVDFSSIDNFIIRTFGRLHYLGSHAPAAVRKKWRIAERKFFQKHEKVL